MIRRSGRLRLFLLALLASSASAEEPSLAGKGWDCGKQALYQLLVLHGIHPDPSWIESELKSPDPAGSSLLELKEAASRVGLRLEGVRLTRQEQLDGAAGIIFLDRSGHGHFCVMRPVGKFGNLVQILGLGPEPVTIRWEERGQVEGWSGIALVPSQDRTWQVVSGLGLAVAASVLGLFLIHRSHRTTAGRISGT